MINIIAKKWLFFLISGLVILPGIVGLGLWGLRASQDFTGGSLIELTTTSKDIFSLEKEIKAKGYIVKKTKDSLMLRGKPINQANFGKFLSQLEKKHGPIKQISFETVGPTIGKETTNKAIQGVIIASLAIVAYITLSFRKIPKPYSSWKFGVCAIVALIHDILLVVGTFSLFGHFFSVEIDSLFITALLTVMGFSVHDTIVVFDRIRENLLKMAGKPFSEIVNESILQTLARSLSTSLTVLFTLTALLLFGGESIRWFIVALLIGIISGTYSSIFNAAPLLVIWEEWKKKR